MKDSLKVALGIVLGLGFVGILCCGGTFWVFRSIPAQVLPTPTPPAAPPSTPTEPPPSTSIATPPSTPTPTPSALGEYITHDGLKYSVMEYRVTNSRMNFFGEEEKPTEGAKFISFHIYVENIGETSFQVPTFIFEFHTEIVYKGENIAVYAPCDEEWASYYSCERKRVYPGTSCKGWICCEIPQAIEPSELIFRLKVPKGNFEEWLSWRLE